MFTCGGTAISWHSQKQTLIATSLNHAEVIVLYEASRECVWLRSMTQHNQTTCGLSISKDLIVQCEDNVAFIIQINECYIKSDRSKHIPSKFFSFIQELEKNKDIDIQNV